MAIEPNKKNSVPHQKPQDARNYKPVSEAKPEELAHVELTFKEFLTDRGTNNFRLTLLLQRAKSTTFWADAAQFYKENMTGKIKSFTKEGLEKAEKIKAEIDKVIAQEKARSLE